MSSTKPDFIHGGVTLTPASTQRKLVEAAWERAKAAGKRLIIRPVGAWSEQCIMFDESLPQFGDELKKQTDRAEYLVLDELYYDRGHGIDWLPADLLAFHAVYLVDPSKGRSSFSVITNVTDARTLAQYLEVWHGSDDFPATLRRLVLDDAPEKTPIPFAHLVAAAAHTTGYSDDLATTKQFIADITALKAKREDLFTGLDVDAIAMRAMLNHLQSGRTTFEELQVLDRGWADRIMDDAERPIEVLYYGAVCNAVRKQGFKAAAALAKERLQAIQKYIPNKPMPYLGGTMVDVSGVQAKLVSFQKVLEALAGTTSLAETEAWVEEILAKNYNFFFLLEIPEVFFALGDYGRAADLVEHTLPRWTEFYSTVTEQMATMAETMSEDVAVKIKAMIPYVKKIPGGTVAAQSKRVELLRQRVARAQA